MSTVSDIGSSLHRGHWRADGPAPSDAGLGSARARTGSSATRSAQVRPRVDTWAPATAAENRADVQALKGKQQFTVDFAAATLTDVDPTELATTVVNAVSDVLGLSAADLSDRLAGGETLSSVAAATETSHKDLITMIRSALPEALQDTQSAALAERIAGTSWPPTADTLQAPSGAGQTLELTLTATASALGTTATHLASRLSQGHTLTELATSAGVSAETLLDAIGTDLADVTTPDGVDTAAIARQIAGGRTTRATSQLPTTRPAAGLERFAVDLGTAAMAAVNPDDLATTVVNRVSDVLGLDPTDLTNRLADGETLSSVASATDTSHSDLISMIRSALPEALQSGQSAGLAEQLASTSWPPAGDNLRPPEAIGQTLDVRPAATAALFGTTATHLGSQLGRGSSLEELAAAAGISADDLGAAVTTDLAGTGIPDGVDTTALGQQIISSHLATAPDLGSSAAATVSRTFTVDFGAAALAGSTPGDVGGLIVDTVGAALGIDADSLSAQLTAGAALSDVADGLGTTHQDLVDAVRTALLPYELQDTQAAALAEQLSAASWPLTGESLRAPAATDQTLDVTLTATATLLGTSTTQLGTQLSQGHSLQDLAATAGISSEDLGAAVTSDLAGATVPDGLDGAALVQQIVSGTDSTGAGTTSDSGGSGSGASQPAAPGHHHHHRAHAWL